MIEIDDRDELIKLIRSLREENQYLRKLLADNNIKTDLDKGELKALSRDDKINIYMSYFKGREDVYALKYISNG